ncbi:MAG: glycosyltransferase family protein [Ignavibacteriales bacterium]|nr:glycosyltransferase family protein [Ignavibacteriales bacterium]
MTQQDFYVVTVVQARMGSSRLPAKVGMSLGHQPLLLRLVERVQHAKLSGTIVVATTTSPKDDIIEEWCINGGIHCYRGDEEDLLDRHYQAALLYNADAVVKIPSDCPLIDPRIINKVIAEYLSKYPEYDYVSNLHPATYPDGNDVEIMSLAALETAWQSARKKLEREHTTPYLWENPVLFRIGNVTWGSGLNYSMSHRWTIDYLEDYLFVKSIFEELHPKNPMFGLYDILNVLIQNPQLKKINAHYAGVNWYRDHLSELKTVSLREMRPA